MGQSRRGPWVARCTLALACLSSVVALAPATTVGRTTDDLAYPLEGTRWRLTDYVVGGEVRTSGPEVDAWLRLGRGKLTGSSGCAKVRGTYATGPDAVPTGPATVPTPAPSAEASPAPGTSSGPDASKAPGASPLLAIPDDARLVFDDVRGGGRDCAEQTMLVVKGLQDGLARTAGFRLLPASPPWTSTLELFDPTGATVLGFRVDDLGPIAGSSWLLDSVDGSPAHPGLDEQPAVLAFDAPGDRRGIATRTDDEAAGPGRLRVTGSTGCNAFSGRYVATASVLTISDLTTTTEPCSPVLAEQEIELLGILGSSSLSLSLPPDALELRSDDGAGVVRYRSAAPLEDEQWILARRSAERLGIDDIVTFSLAPDDPTSTSDVRTGTVSGEGPCRPYTATYRTDGLRIAVDGVAADQGSCARSRAERRFIRALGAAVFAEVDRGHLSLRDAQGRELLGFQTPGLP
jgi:heat shock protein HslJ